MTVSSNTHTKRISHFVLIQIAASYRNNPFHNFEHACHVTMCARCVTSRGSTIGPRVNCAKYVSPDQFFRHSKFLKRIVSPDLSDEDLSKLKDSKKVASLLHTYTNGINSDHMTIFAIVFSAIIHDVVSTGSSAVHSFHSITIAFQCSLTLSQFDFSGPPRGEQQTTLRRTAVSGRTLPTKECR